MTHPLLHEVLSALASSKNVLLRGPPGTGKTWLVSEVVAYLRDRPAPAGGRPTLRLGAKGDQFGTAAAAAAAADLPRKLEVEWVTFHQAYAYEDFIIGRRPKPVDGGLVLEPNFGLLMSLAVDLSQSQAGKGYLLIIDELNRANAGQVFGEFITLLDPDYRATVDDKDNARALRLRFPGIAYVDGRSEPIRMLRGDLTVELPENWTFPEHVYVLATMNSVDKAALPLDSALARRFHRIDVVPNVGALAAELDVDVELVADRAAALRDGDTDAEPLSAEETAVLLLDRLNVLIATDLGEDYEIGHALLRGVVTAKPEARWSALVRVWDSRLFPQVLERYAGREEALRELLKVGQGAGTEPAFGTRGVLGTAPVEDAALKLTPLAELAEADAIGVLRGLAT